MSSLAQQLQQLKQQDSTVIKKNDVVQAASLLFHAKVASAVDLEQIYSLAVTGFQKLCIKDEHFMKFQEVIFGPKYRRIDRNILLKKENEELSEKLQEFLCLVSLHFLEEDAHKVFDYLLRNFNIHHYEAEYVIIYFMHYHATPFYTRLLQNVTLKTREHFGFLNTPISKGELVQRETIAKQINYDSHILAQLIKYNQKVSDLFYSQSNKKKSDSTDDKANDVVFNMVGSDNKTSKLKVNPTSFLQAILIDLLSIKTRLTETFVSSLIETINHFLKRGDHAAISFALIALGSLLIRDKNINTQIIDEFASYLITKISSQQLTKQAKTQAEGTKCVETVVKFLFFICQRNFLKHITIAQLNKLSEAYQFDEIFKASFDKVSQQYSSLNFFAITFNALVSGSLKQFESSISFVESLVEHLQTYDSIYSSSNPELKDQLLKNIVFERFFFSSEVGEAEINVDIQAQVIVFMKKYFLADLIHYLNSKIAEETSNQKENNENVKVEKLKKFMNENFPGSISFHENVLLKRNLIIQTSSSKNKKGAQENREYLNAILTMLNNEQNPEEKKELLANYLDYLVNIIVLKLNVETNSKTLKIVFELLTHSSIETAQSEIEDEQRRNHSKLQMIQGFYRFLVSNLKNQAGVTFKKEIVKTFRALTLRSDSENDLQKQWVFSTFFVLVQSDDLADSYKEIYQTLKDYLPNIFEKLQKKQFPMIDLLLSAKNQFSNFLQCLQNLSKDVLCIQGIANFMANVFDNAEQLALITTLDAISQKSLLHSCLSIIQNIVIDSKHNKSASQIDYTLLNSQVCKFIVKNYNNSTVSNDIMVHLLNFILEQPQYENLILIKSDLIDKLPFNDICLLLGKKFMYTQSCDGLTLQGNIKCLFLINQTLKANTEKVTSQLSYQLFTLALIKLGSAIAQEKQGLFLIMENCKKILKKNAGEFDAIRLSDALNTNACFVGGEDQKMEQENNIEKVNIKYKILLNLCEVVSKHRVELAVHNPPIGKIIAKEVQQQQNNQQRDLNSILNFLMSQIYSQVQSEFLVSFMGIFAEIVKHHHHQVAKPNQQQQQQYQFNLNNIDQNLLIELLQKLRENSYIEKDNNLMAMYAEFYTRLPSDELLNSNFQYLYADVLLQKVSKIENRKLRATLLTTFISALDDKVFQRLNESNQLAYLKLIFENLNSMTFDGLTEHLISINFSKEICQSLLDYLQILINNQLKLKKLSQKHENQVIYMLELILLKEDTVTQELDLNKLFDIIQVPLVTPRIQVLLFRIIKKCQAHNIYLHQALLSSVKNVNKLSEAETASVNQIKLRITGGENNEEYKFIEILKFHLQKNTPKSTDWKTNDEEEKNGGQQEENEKDQSEKQYFELQQLEIVHETADIMCLICSIDFKKITNILFDVLETMYKNFLAEQKQIENEEQNNKQQEVQSEEQKQLTQSQILESKVEFLFEIFGFVAKKLMQHAGEVRRNKLVKFSLLHLQAVFSLLPYFNQQKTSILTKIRQLSEIYGGPSNLLRVLFIQAANNLTHPKMSEVILKEIPSAITELLFSKPENTLLEEVLDENQIPDNVCSNSLNTFLNFIKGVFVQWTTYHSLPSDENLNKLMNPQSFLIAKYLQITSKRPNACKTFIRNSLVLLHTLFKSEPFLRTLNSLIEKPNSTEKIAKTFFSFYYELIRFDNLQKNAMSRCKSQKDGSLLTPFAKPLKRIMQAYAVLTSSFIRLFEIDILFTICALILDNNHQISYHIRSSILEIMNQQLDSAPTIKKKHNFAIIRIVKTLHEEIAANLKTVYLNNNNNNSSTSNDEEDKKVNEKVKKNKKSKQKQISSSQEQRSIQKYLSSCIVLFTTALNRKPGLFQPQNQQIDSAGLMDTLICFVENQNYSFMLKTSLIFLIANLSAQGNKFRVLPHLHSIAGEILRQALGLLYFNDKDSFDTLINIINNLNTSSKSKENQGSSMAEFVKEVFDQQNLEVNIFSQPQYFKHQDSIVKNLDGLFTLVVRSIENLILCLKNLISPYLSFISLTILSFSARSTLNQPLNEFINKLSTLLESRVLLECILLPHTETCQQISPQAVELYTHLLEKTFQQIDSDTLDAFLQEIYKKIFLSLDYTRKQFINKELYVPETVDLVEDAQVKSVAALVIKTNEIQLRKFFMNIVTWSERIFQESECGYHFMEYRKIVLLKIVFQLSETMTSLFTPFFNFIFETQLNQFNSFSKVYSVQSPLDLMQQNASLNKKRKREDNNDENTNIYHQLALKLTELNLASLKSCFQNDKEEFIDTTRFQNLIEPLLSIYDAFYFNAYSDYLAFIDAHLVPTIISLFQLLKEDYKWKTLNYNLLLKTRSENSKIRLAILKTLEKILETFGERYMILVNDILPFISETLDDLDPEVERISKSIVIKLEEISGENIREYFKSK
ncbi:hypothetical protein ABPG74_006503 [Tetrahymena malaccensis]